MPKRSPCTEPPWSIVTTGACSWSIPRRLTPSWLPRLASALAPCWARWRDRQVRQLAPLEAQLSAPQLEASLARPLLTLAINARRRCLYSRILG